MSVVANIINLLPDSIKSILSSIDERAIISIEEIRLRREKPLMIHLKNRDYFVDTRGSITNYPKNAYIVTSKDMKRFLQLISDYSLYAFEEEIKNGYITLKGGYRVGITGSIVVENDEIKSIKQISSFNIRISREVKGCADKALQFIASCNTVYNTLIVSAPQMGKTTLLRDITRK